MHIFSKSVVIYLQKFFLLLLLNQKRQQSNSFLPICILMERLVFFIYSQLLYI